KLRTVERSGLGPRRCQRSARGPPFSAGHQSPNPGSLPRGVIAGSDADAARAQLDDLDFAPLQDAAAGAPGDVVDPAPLEKGEHVVGMRDRLALSIASGLSTCAYGRTARKARKRSFLQGHEDTRYCVAVRVSPGRPCNGSIGKESAGPGTDCPG